MFCQQRSYEIELILVHVAQNQCYMICDRNKFWVKFWAFFWLLRTPKGWKKKPFGSEVPLMHFSVHFASRSKILKSPLKAHTMSQSYQVQPDHPIKQAPQSCWNSSRYQTLKLGASTQMTSQKLSIWNQKNFSLE